jgi:hypothetical protein
MSSPELEVLGVSRILAFPKKVQMTFVLNIARNLSLRLREADSRIVELSRRARTCSGGG